MGLVLVALLLGLGVLLLFATFPPRTAKRWRHWTRPIRRLLRPRHYRAW